MTHFTGIVQLSRLLLSTALLAVLGGGCSKNDLPLSTPSTYTLVGDEQGILFRFTPQLAEGQTTSLVHYLFDIEGEGLWQDKNLNGVKDAGEELIITGEEDGIPLSASIDPENRTGTIALYGAVHKLGFLPEETLEEPATSYTPIAQAELDASRASELRSLSWTKAGISAVQLPHGGKLKSLHLSGNKLSSVDLPKDMEVVVLSSNKLSGVQDFSNFTTLQRLNLEGNDLSELRLPEETALVFLSVNNTPLRELNLKRSPKLTRLYAGECSQLTSLVAGGCPLLNYINLRKTSSLTLDALVEGLPQVQRGDLYLTRTDATSGATQKLASKGWNVRF